LLVILKKYFNDARSHEHQMYHSALNPRGPGISSRCQHLTTLLIWCDIIYL